CDDDDAFALYRSMIRAARERRDQYEANNGPLTQTAATDSGCQWLENPWPWEMGGNR
ncbi:MAG: spore coat protein CotJB, partial [Oscillospiraceae bacterium]|nr:spore coat protein CotJB [Oscillospiraceae bacterium]